MQLLLLVLVLISSARSSTVIVDPEEQVIRQLIQECIESPSGRISCFSEKAAIAMDRAMEIDVPLFYGIQFARNSEKINTTQRHFQSGFGHLSKSLSNFLDTHILKLDLTNHRQARREHEQDNDHHKNQHIKKEKKYMQYAFMVLLGIFGLTGPLVMKTLAVIAAKALIASKVALIIVGSVALKKIFEKDHEHSSVKVHTISEDEHDRLFNTYSQSPYPAYDWSRPV